MIDSETSSVDGFTQSFVSTEAKRNACLLQEGRELSRLDLQNLPAPRLSDFVSLRPSP